VPTLTTVVLIVLAGLIGLAGLLICASIVVRQHSTSTRLRALLDARRRIDAFGSDASAADPGGLGRLIP